MGMAAARTWDFLPECRLVLRPEVAVVALVGPFTDADHNLLTALQSDLQGALEHLRVIGWARACGLATGLGQVLRDQVGEDRLSRARFVAIPRGGVFVLGLLAHALDLEPWQLEASDEAETLVVVDDCALTGARFRQFLARSPHPRIVFAHLCSHPDLRAAIAAREARVEVCAAAGDLAETEADPATVQAWRTRWQARLGDAERYWFGRLEHVVFPWNEPDRTVWDEDRARAVPAFRVVPAELCLKNQVPPATLAARLQVVEEPRGVVELPPDVLYAHLPDRVAIADLARGESFALEGSGVAFWTALLAASDVSEAVTRLSRELQVPEPRIREDLERLLAELESRGLLRRRR